MNDNQPLIQQSLDSREFVMESSTSSVVDLTAPTRFRYHQQNGILWGDYVGDTVSFGRFVGQRDGDRITIDFAHADAVTGAITRGSASSLIEDTDSGQLRLIEDYVFDGIAHRSVCIEVDPVARDEATALGGK